MVYELAVDWISRFHSQPYGIVRGRPSFPLELSLTYSIRRVSLEHLSILVFRDGSACGTLRALRMAVLPASTTIHSLVHFFTL